MIMIRGSHQLFALALTVLTTASAAFATEPVEVFENHGDIILRDGEQQRRLYLPSQLRSNPRFVIRAKRNNSDQAPTEATNDAPKTDDKVAARRIMYQANQAFFKGEIEKTWELIEQAEKLDPDFYRIKSMKGSLLFKIGSKDLAISLWRESLSKNPDQPEIRALLESAEKQL